jgi:regulatory protein
MAAEPQPQTPYEQALLRAYNYLSYRNRSVAEMERYLERKGFAPETVASVIERLVELHYLDDAHFAVSWVESRQRAGGRGPHLLRSELRQKGVARETADEAIADLSADEGEQALDAGRKKAQTLRAADYAEFSRKLGSYLSRRGYSSEAVWEAVKRLWSERESAAAD